MDLYDPGPLRRVAINLFYGWGHNFYRLENQWRADDQLVRAKAAGLLALAHAALDRAEQDFRREKPPRRRRGRIRSPTPARWSTARS